MLFHIHKQHILGGLIYQQRRKWSFTKDARAKCLLNSCEIEMATAKIPDKKEFLQSCKVLILLICNT